MSNYHQPHETASILGITPATLRRWADYHKAYLSPDTQPSSGQPRRFTNRDIEILKHCKHLRDQGLTVTSINEQLVNLTFPEIDQKTEIEPSHDDQRDDHVTAVTQPQTAPLATLDVYGIDEIWTHIAALERSNRSSYYLITIGVVIGLGLALVFELAAMIAAHVR